MTGLSLSLVSVYFLIGESLSRPLPLCWGEGFRPALLLACSLHSRWGGWSVGIHCAVTFSQSTVWGGEYDGLDAFKVCLNCDVSGLWMHWYCWLRQ